MAQKKRRRVSKPSGSSASRKQSATSRKPSTTPRKTVRVPVSRDGKPAVDNPVSRRNKGAGAAKKATAKKPGRAARKKASFVSHVQWTPKERQSKTERSLSAKKGWLTRKFNEKIKAIEAERQREREREAKRDREYQRNVRKQAREAAALAKKEKVIVYREKTLREKGQEIHDKMQERIEQASVEARTEAEKKFERDVDIMKRLFDAQLAGTFDMEAYDIADEYDMEPREVYTLWAYNGAVD